MVVSPLIIAEADAPLVSGQLVEATSAGTPFMVAGCGLFAVLLLAAAILRMPASPGREVTPETKL
jgi:hypothetical protein